MPCITLHCDCSQPLVGHALELSTDHSGLDGFLAQRCNEYGSVSRLFYLGSDLVLLCGAAAADVFSDEKLVAPAEGPFAAGTLAASLFGVSLPLAVGATPTALEDLIYREALAAMVHRRASSFLSDATRRVSYGIDKQVHSPGSSGVAELGTELFPLMTHAIFTWTTGLRLNEAEASALGEHYLSLVTCSPYLSFLPSFMSCFSRAQKAIENDFLTQLRAHIDIARKSGRLPGKVRKSALQKILAAMPPETTTDVRLGTCFARPYSQRALTRDAVRRRSLCMLCTVSFCEASLNCQAY